jgi:hypothetical protein
MAITVLLLAGIASMSLAYAQYQSPLLQYSTVINPYRAVDFVMSNDLSVTPCSGTTTGQVYFNGNPYNIPNIYVTAELDYKYYNNPNSQYTEAAFNGLGVNNWWQMENSLSWPQNMQQPSPGMEVQCVGTYTFTMNGQQFVYTPTTYGITLLPTHYCY